MIKKPVLKRKLFRYKIDGRIVKKKKKRIISKLRIAHNNV